MEAPAATCGLEVFVEDQGGPVGVGEAEIFGAPGFGFEMAGGPDHALGLVLVVERFDVRDADADLGRGGLKMQTDPAAGHAGIVDGPAGLGIFPLFTIQ